MAVPKVVLDANVLFPFTLRDTLLRSTDAGLCQVHWSAEILNEATRNLIATSRMTEPQALRLATAMEAAFPEALVDGYERHLRRLENQAKDRHVAAVAVEAGASLIVTFNLRDFVPLPEGIAAESPDVFLLDLLEANPSRMLEVLRSQASALKRPPVSLQELLGGLAKSVPRFVVQVRILLAETE